MAWAKGLEKQACIVPMHETLRHRRPARLEIASVVLSGFALWGNTIAHAQTAPAVQQHVTASLIAETLNIVAGQPLRVALRQQMQPGWHTYWSNPGESGLATTIEWSLPPGFKAGQIAWPTPERFNAGPVVFYGYKDDAMLPVDIDVPKDLRPGSHLTISARVSWLACGDICVPEEADLSLSIPVGTVSERDPSSAEVFASSRARTPRSNPFVTAANSVEDKITLRVATGDARRLRDVIFFPADADVIDDGAPQQVILDSEGLTLTLKRNQANSLPVALNGILVFRDQAAQTEGSPVALSVSIPIGATNAR